MRSWNLLAPAVAALILAPGAPPAPAAETGQTAPQETAPGRRQPSIEELGRELSAAYKAEDYQRALTVCRTMVELAPRHPVVHYNQACALARLGHADEALTSLAKAVEAGYTEAEHMTSDEDLATLRAEPRFDELVKTATVNHAKAEARFYEKGAEIAGVRTVEGQPEGGLRWRLRISPEATPEKPQRLVMWLHPSGGSMNDVVEKLAPELNRHGCALLVIAQKQWDGWTRDEGRRLLSITLPDVARTPGVNAEKPLLLGFSAGGQAALTWYLQDPGLFGGLILDAAYPLDVEQYQRGRMALARLPADEDTLAAIGKVPFFVLVGTADGGSGAWRKAEKPYREAGMPLVVHYVKDGKHEWLLGKPQLAALLAWLDEVVAGRFPQGEVGAAPQKPVDASRD